MPLPSLLPVIGDFKTNAVRIGKEGGPVVRRIVWMQSGFSGVYSGLPQVRCHGDDIRNRINAKAKMVQPW